MEGQRLRVFENRVLRRIFGSKSGEVIEGWGKQHKKELCKLVLFACWFVCNRSSNSSNTSHSTHTVRMLL
jgi:hypothetical protein